MKQITTRKINNPKIIQKKMTRKERRNLKRRKTRKKSSRITVKMRERKRKNRKSPEMGLKCWMRPLNKGCHCPEKEELPEDNRLLKKTRITKSED